MLVRSFITLVQKNFPDWSRELIRTYLDDLQTRVFSQNATRQMRMYSTTTGVDPILTTTAGTYVYEINITNGFSNNAWRIYEVYASDIDDPEDVVCFDATKGVAAKVVFKSDPTSTTYYIRAYRFPTSITSESIELEVPEAYHMSHLFEGVCGLIEKFRSGKSERYDIFEKILLPDLVNRMSDGKRGSSYSTTYREC